MRTGLLVLLFACGAPAEQLEPVGVMPVDVECRQTIDDRERLDCLYAEQDCADACGSSYRFRQFPAAGEPQCECRL